MADALEPSFSVIRTAPKKSVGLRHLMAQSQPCQVPKNTSPYLQGISSSSRTA